MFNFEKLEVWNEAIAFADTIYTLTKAFPDDERFGLTNQCGGLRCQSPRISPRAVRVHHGPTSPASLRLPQAHCLKWSPKPRSARGKASSVSKPTGRSTRLPRSKAGCSAGLGIPSGWLNWLLNSQLSTLNPQPLPQQLELRVGNYRLVRHHWLRRVQNVTLTALIVSHRLGS